MSLSIISINKHKRLTMFFFNHFSSHFSAFHGPFDHLPRNSVGPGNNFHKKFSNKDFKWLVNTFLFFQKEQMKKRTYWKKKTLQGLRLDQNIRKTPPNKTQIVEILHCSRHPFRRYDEKTNCLCKKRFVWKFWRNSKKTQSLR